MERKGISTKMQNRMKQYIGKTYQYRDLWKVTVKEPMGDTGYYVTEVSDGEKTWQSNASYGEIMRNLKKGIFVES